jgi:CRP-like cAMP-binding protein
MEKTEIKTALSGCEFFKGLDDADIQKVVALCWERNFETGETLFQQGDFGEHLYVIAEGQVVLERSVDLGHRKGTVTIEALGRGRVTGSWSTLLDQPHWLMSSAVCQKPPRVLVFRGADLRNLMLSNKDVGFNIMESFCFMLKDRIQAAYGAMEKI